MVKFGNIPIVEFIRQLSRGQIPTTFYFRPLSKTKISSLECCRFGKIPKVTFQAIVYLNREVILTIYSIFFKPTDKFSVAYWCTWQSGSTADSTALHRQHFQCGRDKISQEFNSCSSVDHAMHVLHHSGHSGICHSTLIQEIQKSCKSHWRANDRSNGWNSNGKDM